MSWAYGVTSGGKEVGYNVKAQCEHPGCGKRIHRGLAYACGGYHDASDVTCDGYFCYGHLVWCDNAKMFVCPSCRERNAKGGDPHAPADDRGAEGDA